MSSNEIISMGFSSVKYNKKTDKWDVKFLINNKVKWIRGFSTETDATICAQSYFK
jgi:hypothetical protein